MKIVGHDVTVYNWELFGVDKSPSAGAVTSMLGRWETIEVKWKKNWADVSSSDADEPEMRKLTDEWSASCKTLMDQNGSQAIFVASVADYVLITFTDEISGRTCTLIGGIDEAGMSANREAWKDNLEVSSKGRISGAATFQYG